MSETNIVSILNSARPAGKGKAVLLAACVILWANSGIAAEEAVTPAQPATPVSETVAIIPASTSATLASDSTSRKLPRIIDFGSKQCQACKAMEPVLESLATNHADKFITEFVDVWVPENQDRARSHAIQSIPTQVFFDSENKEVFRNTGFISEKDVLAKWAELGILMPSIASETPTFEPATPANASETAKGE
ncbi:MAG TPA: thioredoxin family protein [Candidatus Rifleibacterium sp.]|nr:thioredoxin family protein [Candidatus Rifleibacterium sp.]HPT45718.1 thioredoxin family protein [Candidatus Rifleibacterium sp.]